MKKTTLTRRVGLKQKTRMRWDPKKTKARKLRNQARATTFAFQRLAKPAQEVDADYLAWVKQQPCVVTGREAVGGCDPAHVKTRGSGGSDYDAIPLLHAYHVEQHQTGFATFAAKYKLNYSKIIKILNDLYVQKTGKNINRRSEGYGQ